MKEQFLIANISWNPTGWRNTYINPKAGHSYARKYPGHESLNFRFDKEGIDTDDCIYGFIQWRSKPVNFNDGGICIFYTNNTDENKGQIVGIYSNVKILDKRIKVPWNGFENNILDLNIQDDKALSILFPIPLDASLYKESSSKRLTGQIGYSYYNISLAEKIVELRKSGIQATEIEKLKDIYTFITGNVFDLAQINQDEIEQQELVELFKDPSEKEKILDDLSNLKESESETIYINQKVYKRDNKTIAQLKILRGFQCQICGTKIIKRDGSFYVEAAHIKPKHRKGRETPNNILILCPNHHKEFDYGDRKIETHSMDEIIFQLNGRKYIIDLGIY